MGRLRDGLGERGRIKDPGGTTTISQPISSFCRAVHCPSVVGVPNRANETSGFQLPLKSDDVADGGGFSHDDYCLTEYGRYATLHR